MRIDAVVSDLDGTLLNAQGQLSPYTVETVRMCTERGIPFIPCSGRTVCSMLPFLKQLATGFPAIGGNGSELIAPDGSLLEQMAFLHKDALRLVRHFEGKGLHIQAYRGENFLYSRESAYSRRYAASSGLKGVETGDLSACLNFPTPKLLVIATPDTVEAELEETAGLFGDFVTVTRSGTDFLDLQPAGVTKASGVKRLAARMNLDPGHILAFGDSPNDISMLTAVGSGCAVSNAVPAVLSAAKLRCGSNTEDGPAHYIRKFVLGEEEA